MAFSTIFRPFQRAQARGRGVQFRTWRSTPILQYSSLRVAGFEDEDEDDDE